MAQAGFTPISLYFSTTAAAVPSSANLVAGELALNTVDEKLYFKNSAGTVKLLASNATSAPVLSFQTSLGGLTPSTATTGVVTLAGTLNTTSGGTGLTSFTAGDVPYYASGSVLSKLAIGTAGQFLTSTGTAPQWSTLSGVAVTTFSAGTTGFTPSSATSGAVTLAGTLATTNGGTGLTSFTSGGVVYASSTSALATGSQFAFDGTNVKIGVHSFAPNTNLAGNLLQLKTAGGIAYLTMGNGDSANQTNYVGSASDVTVFGSVTDAGATTERMRLTSTGLGIGTSSPNSKLEVSGSVGSGVVTATVTNSDASGFSTLKLRNTGASGRDYQVVVGGNTSSQSNNFYIFDTTASAVRFTISPDGNAGLGVTPSAWGSTYKAFQAGTTGVIAGIASQTDNFVLHNYANAFYDGTNWKYIASQEAGRYELARNTHKWFNAPSGTAGNAITFTQAMTLDASGSLGVGTTGPNAKLEVSIATLTSGTVALFSSPSYESVRIFAGLSSGIGTVSTSPFGLSTNSTVRFQIGGSGQFGIGASPDYGTNGQVLTSSGSAAAPTWTTVSGGGSPATPTAEGTVYGKMTASGGSPYLTALGYNAGLNNTGTNNVFVGLSAGQANTSGGSNVALGYGALDVNTTSSNSVAIGADALGQASVAISGFGGETVAIGYRALYSAGTVASNSTGGCTAIGHAAGYSTASAGNGAYDTFIGYLAGYYNVSGYNCTFVGAQAGYGQTSGNANTIVGQGAGRQTSGAGGGNNTFVGVSAGSGNSGNDNTFVGVNAGNTNAGASENCYFGTYAAQSCTGAQNVAIGKGAMYSATSANYNVAVGMEALYSQTSTTGYHTAVGWQALRSSTDNSNVGIGYQAGKGVTVGHSNTFIGTNAAYATVITTTGAQNIVIGSNSYTNTASASFEIVIGIGCNGLGNDRVTIGKLNSRIWAQYDSSATWTYASDVRLKKDIEDDSLGLAFINKLRPVKYRWKATNELELDNPQYNEVNNKNTNVVMHGLIAQEVKAALDEEGVSTFEGWNIEPNGIQCVSREMFITPLINAVQELTAQIETLKAEIAILKGNA